MMGDQFMRVLMGGNTAGLSLDFLPLLLLLAPNPPAPAGELGVTGSQTLGGLRHSGGTGSCLPQGPPGQAGPAGTCRRKAVGFI